MKLPHSPRKGFILVAVLVVVMLSSMVVISLLFRLRADETAAVAGAGAEQAWAAAMSGVYEAMRLAASSPSGSLDWEDNPEAFRDRFFFEDGSDHWYFTVYTMGDSDDQQLRFGLSDEAAKLNVNEATEAMLEKLPGMTPYLVHGLLDFLDSDDTPRPEGAEQEYYDSLPHPYTIFNGPLSTIEEILLVRGFTPAVFYGEDANLNFQLDANEDDGSVQFPPDNSDGKLDAGLRPFLTVASYDLNENAGGLPRFNLNDLSQSFDPENLPDSVDLPPQLLEYIAALRRSKITLSHPAQLLEAKGKFKDEKNQDIELESGIGKTELPLVLDLFTTTTEQRLPGLININTASARVLQTLPGIDEALADSIVSVRPNLSAEQRRTPAWLYQEGVLDADQLKTLAPFLTARSLQFHFHVLGYGVPSGRYRVLEARIDLAGSRPVLTYLRDLTRLGLPVRIELPDDGSPVPALEPGITPRASVARPQKHLNRQRSSAAKHLSSSHSLHHG
jgi:DNA uptake protein ComE-like DNA-binding protein